MEPGVAATSAAPKVKPIGEEINHATLRVEQVCDQLENALGMVRGNHPSEAKGDTPTPPSVHDKLSALHLALNLLEERAGELNALF